MRLQGKRVLVTAAGQGIGRAAVEALAREGAEVWATDVNQGLLEQAYAHQAQVHAQRLDVLDKQAIAAAIAAMPGIDVLFNCAGVVHNGSILDATDEDLAFALDLNVRAQFWAIQAALPRMLANDNGQGGQGKGSIVNMASVCSSLKGLASRCVYGTSKAAVIGLTKSVAADYVARGIRCNAIAPGTVDTPSLGERINSYADPAEARKAFVARQPMGRLAQAAEIVPIVVYLASDESVFATGQVFSVDGGMTI
ncbi:SDR family oxidoreductase [Pseudorhodoferax sp.]|uniref:SDR family oxidoreductase n=1 Tax=Pseudorhodoferax sp. TaxID=1993553 RepID=UPI002DD6496B|nr:SDR family oxidoreductase [Pseudorhodoferax sp.]